MGGRLAASICYQMLLVNVFAEKRYCLWRNAPLEYISQRKSASRSKIIVWQAQNMGVCLFGGRGRRAKSPSPFRLPWRASDYPSRRTRSSHLAFHLQKIAKWRQLEPVKSIRKKAPKKMFPRSFKVRIFWRIFCWRCVN